MDLSRPLSDQEAALQAAVEPFIDEIRQMGFEVFGTYRVALVDSRRDTVLRVRVSFNGGYKVEAPNSKGVEPRKFGSAKDAVAFLMESARAVKS